MPTFSAAPLTDAELRLEQRRTIRNAIAAAIFCGLALWSSYVLLPLYFEFPVELSDRLAFAIRADVFVFLWIVVGVRIVARQRFRSAADNRGAAFGQPSPAIAVPVAFLQNTVEQVVAAVGAHLALATLLDGAALSLIPAAIALFAIGRLAFLIGYPKGAGARAFGMVTTVLPTMGAYALAIWLMIAQWG
jgi:hypothetical protein